MWQAKKLEDVVEKTKNKDPRKTPDESFQYIDVSSVSRSSFAIEKTTRTLGIEAPSRARKLVKSGDVIFATIRPTLQRIAVVPDDLDGQICSTGYFVFRPRPEVNNKFLFYYLLADHFSSQMEILQKGASYPAVNDSEVKTQEISYPAIDEQKRIVAILDEAFSGIDQAIANTEKNLANAKELFESYLNNIFTQKGEGWEQVKLSDLATDITDGDHSAPPKSSTGIPFITISNIDKRTRKIDFSSTFKVPENYYRNLKENKRPRYGDVLYTVTGSYGIPVIISNEGDFCFQRHIGLIRPKPETDSVWLNYLLMSPIISQQADVGATGTAQKTVSLKLLRNMIVPKVPHKEQLVMSALCDEIFKKTHDLENTYNHKLKALKELKQSLLQKAFAGELTSDIREVA